MLLTTSKSVHGNTGKAAALEHGNEVNYERGTVEIQGERVGYELYAVDARSNRQREDDTQHSKPDGNIIVVVPGHGQSIHGPKKLVAAAALLSRSKIVWCIDPIPAKGGDCTEAQAIARVVEERIEMAFPAGETSIAATLIGWSHGGSEALRAAEGAPDLFPQYLGLCPTGLVDRHPLELLRSFSLEAARIVWASVCRRDWVCLKDTLRLGWNAGVGLVRDLWRSKSPRRLAEDIGWAGRKVPGKRFGYRGEVVLLFGALDTVVRWRDVLPGCDRPQDIPTYLAKYQAKNFPLAQRIEVEVVPGDHAAPEVNAASFLQTGLGLLGQLDEGGNERKKEGIKTPWSRAVVDA
jgi:pimeloyl-ACP methyl ester carboxylesterase